MSNEEINQKELMRGFWLKAWLIFIMVINAIAALSCIIFILFFYLISLEQEFLPGDPAIWAPPALAIISIINCACAIILIKKMEELGTCCSFPNTFLFICNRWLFVK